MTSPPRTARWTAAALTSAGLATVLLGVALPLIDLFIVNVALPTIAADLEASAASLELIVAGYGASYAALLVVGGRLGDLFGRRRLFILGLSTFTLTSLLCGIAPDISTLVIARVAQGATAAMLLPQVLAIIQATTDGERRARALGMYSATAGIATVVGQVLGGALVAADLAGLGWRLVFLVNVPVGLAGVLLARRVPESRAHDPLRVDIAGAACLGLCLLALLIPLTEGQTLGWPAWTWVLLAVVPIAVIAFRRIERRQEANGDTPLVPSTLVRLPSLRCGLLVAGPYFAVFGGFIFVYAIALQRGLGLDPLSAGLTIAPMPLGFFATSLANSRITNRLGRWSILLGLSTILLATAGLIAITATGWPAVNTLAYAPALLLMGLGQGMTLATLFRVALAQVPTTLSGVGSGMLTTTQQASQAIGAAVFGGLFAALTGPLGIGGALVLVLSIKATGLALVLALARRLPDPRT